MKQSRKTEMLFELMDAKERGIETVWYGNIENAEPIGIDDAIRDITKMDDEIIGEGTWGEY
jgi:hypothetical protein